jgi:hypothetical protein
MEMKCYFLTTAVSELENPDKHWKRTSSLPRAVLEVKEYRKIPM